MKKHILGVALFSLIVASFVLTYAFFYSPSIPPKESVKPPLSKTEAPKLVRSYSDSTCKKLSYKVISSELNGLKLTSKVRVFWNGKEAAPNQIYLRPSLFNVNQQNSMKTFEPILFTKVFEKRDEATLIVVSDLSRDIRSRTGRGAPNWYVNFNISRDVPAEDYSLPNVSESHPILFVHDVKQ